MSSTISPQELGSRLRGGSALELIDVRTPAEFEEVHVVGATNLPLDRLDAKAFAAKRTQGGPVYVICKSGGRSKQACEKLHAAGVPVVNIDGGTMACESAGLPVVRGKKTISLERQVRIAAGLLVLLGVGLSMLHPYWIGISAFVGAGLVFAGITDTCGMAMLLAKMPWNQSGSSCCR